MKSLNYAYIGRRRRKRDFRKLWIVRINAAARLNGLSYSKFMHGLSAANINLNRKVLAELAVNDSKAFAQLAEKAKAALGQTLRYEQYNTDHSYNDKRVAVSRALAQWIASCVK